MSVSGGPTIIDGGLVLYLDAANIKSTPVRTSSNNSWYNIVTSSLYQCDTTNSTTWYSGSKGYLNFNQDLASYGELLNSQNNSDLNFGSISGNTNDFTIEAWANYYLGKQYGHIYYGYGSELFLNATGSMVFNYYKYVNEVGLVIQASVSSSAYSIELGKWNHIAVTRVASTHSIYINGKLSGTFVTGSAQTVAPLSNWIIGRNAGGPSADAKISMLKVYKGKGFSANEVLNSYNNTRGRFEPFENPTYLISENFEGAGIPSGWFGNGVDWDYTIAPLAGAKSARMGIEGSYGGGSIFAETAEVWGKFVYRMENASVGRIFSLGDPNNNEIFYIYRQSLGTIVASAKGGTEMYSISTVDANTVYYVWFYYKKGTGSSAIAKVWFSKINSKPPDGSDGYSSMTDGISSTNADRFGIMNIGDSVGVTYDNIQLSTKMFE